MKTFRYILAFGSNLGDRMAHCDKAVQLLKELVVVRKESERLRTEPLKSEIYSTEDHEWYLNFVIEVESDLDPLTLYTEIRRIEDSLGHDRNRKWRPRQIDIDILFCARNLAEKFIDCPSISIDAHGLRIPHSGFWQRSFLVDLVENGLGIYFGMIPST